MEYERLIYTNENGGSIEFSPKSAFFTNIANDVTGIADVKNKIYSTESMGQHGETFAGQKVEARDITISGNINRTGKAEMLALRRKAQKVLNPSFSGKLTYIYGDFTRVIDCRVEDAPVFTRKKVYEAFKVSLECPSPFWRDASETATDIASWIGELEFAMEIPEEDGMEFGYREPNVIVVLTNEGDVETGMRIKFSAAGTVETPLLLNVKTGEYIQLNATLKGGDVVVVNTQYGSKGATRTNSGVTEDFFKYIDVDSTFMQLAVGDNVFKYDAADGLDFLSVTVYHSNKYLGV